MTYMMAEKTEGEIENNSDMLLKFRYLSNFSQTTRTSQLNPINFQKQRTLEIVSVLTFGFQITPLI